MVGHVAEVLRLTCYYYSCWCIASIVLWLAWLVLRCLCLNAVLMTVALTTDYSSYWLGL